MKSAFSWLIQLLKNNHKKTTPQTVIYCQTVNSGIALFYKLLRELPESVNGPSIIKQFYGSHDEQDRRDILQGMKSEKVRVLISTLAFGMGVNVNTIQNVVHWGPPNDTQDYWQGVGRAGRDGRQAYAYLYISPHRRLKTSCSPQMKTLISTFKSGNCVRAAILQHFEGESPTVAKKWQKRKRCGFDCKCPLCLCCSSCKATCECQKTV